MAFVIASVALNALAQIAMKMASSKGFDLRSMFTNSALWIAALLYLASIFLWLKALAQLPLSKAYPYQSFGYLLVFLLSYLILKEQISLVQIFGLTIICFGIFVLGFSQ